MSLLMQALKKAERARQSGLQEEDLPGGGVGLPNDTAPEATHGDPGATDMPAGRTPPAASGPLELSLEPLDAGPPAAAAPAGFPPAAHAGAPAQPARQAPLPPSPPPAIEPAVEASHNPVPPQARHEGGRARADTGDIPVRDARAAPRPAGAATEERRGPGAPERRAVPRTAPARAENDSGIDLARLRVVALGGVLLVVAGTFGYLYWQAVNGPGPGASLPMVPMPPPSATGATSAGGDGGIVVAPSGPPFGALGVPAPVAQPDSAAAPPADMTLPPIATTPDVAPPAAAPRSASRPARRAERPAAPITPTAAQLAAIEDPEIRREAMRDAIERAEQAERAGRGFDADPLAADGAGAPVTGSLAAPDSASRGDVQVARGASGPAISPAVQAGYAAFAAGDLAAARRQYGAALRSDPNNRDALLGSAAVALRERRGEDAAGLYTRLLAINPRDPDAIAGLAALRPGDGERAEVRLRGVLRNNPDAAAVHFALGNLYARQRRWQEAQQAYFQAWSAAPGNADYAFNLAVGLDRLNQGRLARDYYQRALALAAGSPAAFDRAAVQRRLLELGSAPAATPAPPGVTPAPAAPAAPAAVPALTPAPEPAPAPAVAGN